MTSDDRELLQENILAQCHRASRKGVRFNAIVSKARSDGYKSIDRAGRQVQLTEEDVEAEIRYLEGNNFIKEVDKRLSPENRRYVATPAGTDYLREEGLENE